MRKIFLVAAMAVSALAVNAQATFGVKAGANFSSLKYSGDGEDDNTDTKVGLNIGGLANIPVSSMFSFQPELVFSMEGGEDEQDGEDYKLKMNYINVPLLLQYNASGFIAETGPQVGFLMSADAELGDVEIDVKDQMETVNLSWAIGLGYKMTSGFGVNARYNLGLSNIAKESEGDFKTKANTIQVGVFYTFGGGASARK